MFENKITLFTVLGWDGNRTNPGPAQPNLQIHTTKNPKTKKIKINLKLIFNN